MIKIYIWGTGYESERCISHINYEKCQVSGYIETNPQKAVWMGKEVYSAESLCELQYDYVIIANTYADEILNFLAEKGTIDEEKIIDWIKLSENIYHYSSKIWKLFTDNFIEDNFYVLDMDRNSYLGSLSKKLDGYDKVYIYDLRLIKGELDIGALFSVVLNNLQDSRIGMAFIPNEQYLDINWYHNLLYIIDRNAIVIWKKEEGVYADYIKSNPEKFSFRRFGILQFERKQIRTVHKGKYMEITPKLVYEEKRELIKQAKHIKIHAMRSDRIGEEIRILNSILCEEYERDTFKLYISVDAYNRPFESTNTCLNELAGRKINILKNPEEYYLWIRDIFETYERYEYSGKVIDVRHIGYRIKSDNTPLMDFNEEELEYGRELINNKFGIVSEYVCMHTRDAEYLRKTLPNMDTAYHDYRDVPFDVLNDAIDFFDNAGIQTVRMGQIAEEKEVHGKCLNFANRGYDEFLDLIFMRFCKFFVGTDSGIAIIPQFFGRPIIRLFIFYPMVGQHCYLGQKEDLGIFKRIYNVKEKRELSFSEIFDAGIEFWTKGRGRGEHWEQNNLELIPFSPEDVLDVAIEMNEKLDGTWQSYDEDIRLHDIFISKLKKSIEKYNIDVSGVVRVDVATSFLRRYRHLLEG